MAAADVSGRKQFLFFQRPVAKGAVVAAARPPDTELVRWRPTATDLRPPLGSEPLWRYFVFWLIFGVVRRGSRHEYFVIVDADGTPVSTCSVQPRYFRFPFMSQEDVSISGVYTETSRRGKGLATAVVGAALDALAATGPSSVWYVVEADNAASVQVAERNGFVLVGLGSRRARLRSGRLARYVIDTPA